MFTIGEFSRISRVSARILRNYDEMGLLRPARIGEENGYRYYESSQLSELLRIETLKGYGFTLAEIGELLPMPQERLAEKFRIRREKAFEELSRLQGMIRRLEDAISQSEGLPMQMFSEQYHVIVMNAPEQKVYFIRRNIRPGEIHGLFEELYQEMERKGIVRAGAAQMCLYGEGFSEEGMDAEAQMQISPDAKEGENVRRIPGGTFAAVTHTGTYETIQNAYDSLCRWLSQHPEYRVCGPVIERFLQDERTAADPEKLETGVLFPIERLQ